MAKAAVPLKALTSRGTIEVMDTPASANLSKVPAVTLLFWLIKIAATTLGETGGDAVTMSLHAGYVLGTAI